MWELLNNIWGWLKSVWLTGSNLIKIMEGQKEISKRLGDIEQAIKSPQYQVAELEKIEKNTGLLKEYYELEIKKIKAGGQEEIDKHKAKIIELAGMVGELDTYKDRLADAIGTIKEKNFQIGKLTEQVAELRQKAEPLSSLKSLLTDSLPPRPSLTFGQMIAEILAGKGK